MPFVRVQLSLDNSSWYTLPINPIEADLQDSDEINNVETLDGPTIQQRSQFDSRIRKFTWKNLPQKDPYLAMVNQLKSYKGIGTIYMKLNRLDFDTTQSLRIKIINITTTLSSNASLSSVYKMKWDTVELEFVKVIV